MSKRKEAQPRGQSLVEVALTFPILVMLLLGLLDFGRAYYALVILNDCAAEGAAYAATHQDGNAIKLRVRHAEETSLVPMDDTEAVDVDIWPEGAALESISIGSSVTVTATYQMRPLYTPFVTALVGSDSLTLRGSATQVVLSLSYLGHGG